MYKDACPIIISEIYDIFNTKFKWCILFSFEEGSWGVTSLIYVAHDTCYAVMS